MVDWKLTFLGTAASAMSLQQNPTTLLVTVGNNHVLIECAEGTTRRLIEAGIDMKAIDKVFISHGHNDHFIGIMTFLWQNVLVARREAPLEIIAPGYVLDRITTLFKLTSTPDDFINFELRFTDIDAEELFSEHELLFTPSPGTINGWKMTRRHAPLVHDPAAHAIRIDIKDEDDVHVVSFCYACDTSPTDSVARLAEGCDYLIHEATLLDEDIELATRINHSTPSGVGQVASLAGVENLVLVHYSLSLAGKEEVLKEQAKRTFAGNIIIARDMMSLPLEQ
nr:MBL fold metallo-hydrolase [Candidatus Sigynarchaeota archaeon]